MIYVIELRFKKTKRIQKRQSDQSLVAEQRYQVYDAVVVNVDALYHGASDGSVLWLHYHSHVPRLLLHILDFDFGHYHILDFDFGHYHCPVESRLSSY
jgi:hypothetical protein